MKFVDIENTLKWLGHLSRWEIEQLDQEIAKREKASGHPITNTGHLDEAIAGWDKINEGCNRLHVLIGERRTTIETRLAEDGLHGT